MRLLCFVLLAVGASASPPLTNDDQRTTTPDPETSTWQLLAAPETSTGSGSPSVRDTLRQQLNQSDLHTNWDEEITEIFATAERFHELQKTGFLGPDDEFFKWTKDHQASGAHNLQLSTVIRLAKTALVLVEPNNRSLAASVRVRGDVKGLLTIRQASPPLGKTIITGTLRGLTPGLHGFHIHEFGNLTDGCTSTGGHYNPLLQSHGGPTSSVRHIGDLGNIMANSKGVAAVDITDRKVALAGPYSVIGRAVVVHSGADDLGLGGDSGSTTAGNAGVRVGCGVIGQA